MPEKKECNTILWTFSHYPDQLGSMVLTPREVHLQSCSWERGKETTIRMDLQRKPVVFTFQLHTVSCFISHPSPLWHIYFSLFYFSFQNEASNEEQITRQAITQKYMRPSKMNYRWKKPLTLPASQTSISSPKKERNKRNGPGVTKGKSFLYRSLLDLLLGPVFGNAPAM